jgi:hypothetical protein
VDTLFINREICFGLELEWFYCGRHYYRGRIDEVVSAP